MYLSQLLTRDDDVRGVNRGAQVTGVACAALFCPWLAVSARFYVRLGIQKMFGKEDYLTLASLVVMTTLCALLLDPVLKFGLGAHMRNITNPYLDGLSMYIFACEILYIFTTALTKLSIGFYFLRLTNKRFQINIIHSTMAVVTVVSILYLFFMIFQCHPVNFLWTQFSNGQGHCQSKTVIANVTYAHAAMSALTDWVFGIMPVLFVWRLRMDPKTKFSVILILSLGFFASTATLVRIYYIHSLESTTDYTWEGINLVKWSIIEPAIALTAAAFATLRPLFQKFFPSKPKPLKLSSTSSTMNGESRETLHSTRYSGESYTSEFAAMLGLTRVGVTTVIYADNNVNTKKKRRCKKNNDSQSTIWPGWREKQSDSTAELNDAESGYGDSKIDWSSGIRTTTTVTRTIET